ncbi:uncharacterized protein Dwil_GK27793 [Drosophila willistoni]|uniref:female-specific protein transformer n=1 Tax=Drosophila willistoni TaxID=7260 RepID=UPI0007328B14|nr:female-specific protein transformer [Drosophila willistoni]KRF99080.1 uncharacterized protein Dwil_GK27793 [Drosophila willistoni]
MDADSSGSVRRRDSQRTHQNRRRPEAGDRIADARREQERVRKSNSGREEENKIPYFTDVRRESDRRRNLHANRTPSPPSYTTIRSRIRYSNRSNNERSIHGRKSRSRSRERELYRDRVAHRRHSRSRSRSPRRRHSPMPRIITIPVPVPAPGYPFNYAWPATGQEFYPPLPQYPHPPRYRGGGLQPPPYSYGSTFHHPPRRAPRPPSRYSYYRQPQS